MPVESMLLLVVGVAVLTAGAELLVRGSARLAASMGVSPLVIGLTIVAYGTSTPELVVSLQSGLRGQDDVAVANVVGSNIFNVLFILGACALILPLKVHAQLVRFDVPIMIAASVVLWVMAADGTVGKLDGAILTGLILTYTWWSIRKSRQETRQVQEEFEGEFGKATIGKASPYAIALDLLFIALGLVLLVLGGRWFVDGSIDLARYFGVSEVLIGLTIVAAGTSLPEVATSIVATLRGERDIAIGNVVGSNIYNILAILGVASLATGGGLSVNPLLLQFDIPAMTIVALACLPIFFTELAIARWEGGLFLIAYVAYLAWQIGNSVSG